MIHSLADRMEQIRAANSDPRLTYAQRCVLVYLATRMPLNEERHGEGWRLRTETIAAETFPGSSEKTAKNMARNRLRELEEFGAITRAWAGSRRDHNQSATYFVEWEWLGFHAEEIDQGDQGEHLRAARDTGCGGHDTEHGGHDAEDGFDSRVVPKKYLQEPEGNPAPSGSSGETPEPPALVCVPDWVDLDVVRRYREVQRSEREAAAALGLRTFDNQWSSSDEGRAFAKQRHALHPQARQMARLTPDLPYEDLLALPLCTEPSN